jgi:hypothetical protein
MCQSVHGPVRTRYLHCDRMILSDVLNCTVPPLRVESSLLKKTYSSKERERSPDRGRGLLLGRSTEWFARNGHKTIDRPYARRGIAPPPCAWSIEMGQCSGTRPPPGAVSPSRKRDQEAARSNRRASLVPVPVTSQWCAQEAAGQAARTPWPPGRQHGRGPS